MISGFRFWILIALIILVYLAGLPVILFENDSAQFAVMAMRMVQESDFINLIKGHEEYLDKPHLHYWLAAGSYLIFGIQDWAYRIPAILASLLGAYGCYGLGKELYGKKTGRLASLIFLSSQTIVLSNIDVRTDAVLTGFTALALWKLLSYINRGQLIDLAIGAIAAGLAFSTKGQIALVVIGLPLLCHMAYEKRWNRLLSWKILAGIAVFGIVLIPILYAYYHQFDLHPEKVIRGKSGRSGIFFILWEQSFERLSGEGVGKNSSDYFFFFHTYLWVFLPWTIVGLIAFGRKCRSLVRNRFSKLENLEVLTIGGISSIFILISFAQFKLPHYLNITIPLFAVLSASFLVNESADLSRRLQNFLMGSQIFITSLIVLASLLICFWVFPVSGIFGVVILLTAIVMLAFYSWRNKRFLNRLVVISFGGAVLLNGVMNLQFYPSLLQYQGGSSMAEIVEKENIPVNTIFKLSDRHTWGLDFYNHHPVQKLSLDKLATQEDIWLYTTDQELKTLQQRGFDWDRQYTVDQFRITRLQGRFLNPDSREKILNKMHLVHIY